MQCVNNSAAKNEQFVTQVLAGLTLHIPSPVHVGTTAVTVVVKVTDAGDPVQSATVHLDGKTVKTNLAGRASFTLPASIKAGSYPVTVIAPQYRVATGTLVVKK